MKKYICGFLLLFSNALLLSDANPIVVAIKDSGQSLENVKKIIDENIDKINEIDSEKKTTPLLAAIHISPWPDQNNVRKNKIIEYLLDKGADVNKTNEESRPQRPLLEAIMKINAEMINLILSKNPELQDPTTKETALRVAAVFLDEVDFPLFETILQRSEKLIDEQGVLGSALSRSLEQGKSKFAKALLEKSAKIRPNDIVAAAERSDLLELLIKYGGDINITDGVSKNSPLIQVAAYGSIEQLKNLLNKDANVTLKDIFGNTALMASIPKQDFMKASVEEVSSALPKIKLLLEKNNNINEKDKSGNTALDIAMDAYLKVGAGDVNLKAAYLRIIDELLKFKPIIRSEKLTELTKSLRSSHNSVKAQEYENYMKKTIMDSYIQLEVELSALSRRK